MIKILMIGPDRKEKGGIATVINNFSKCKSAKIYFLTNWRSTGWLVLFIKNIFTLRYQIRKSNINIVHFHVAQGGSFFRKSFLLFLIPKDKVTIFHMHASKFNEFYAESHGLKKIWIDLVFKRVDSIVAVSEQWKAYYESITKKEVSFINNSVEVQKSTCFDPKSKRIVTLGRIGKRKGSYDILKAAQMISKIDPEIKFELYGDGDLTKIKTLISEMSNITAYSWINANEFKNRLRGSTLHLLPSYNEGLPMAVLETMALGIPNITSDVGGLRSVIHPEETGWLIKAGNPDQIVKQILSVINNPQELSFVSKRSKEIIEEKFSLALYFQFWLNHYDTLLHQ